MEKCSRCGKDTPKVIVDNKGVICKECCKKIGDGEIK